MLFFFLQWRLQCFFCHKAVIRPLLFLLHKNDIKYLLCDNVRIFTDGVTLSQTLQAWGTYNTWRGSRPIIGLFPTIWTSTGCSNSCDLNTKIPSQSATLTSKFSHSLNCHDTVNKARTPAHYKKSFHWAVASCVNNLILYSCLSAFVNFIPKCPRLKVLHCMRLQ